MCIHLSMCMGIRKAVDPSVQTRVLSTHIRLHTAQKMIGRLPSYTHAFCCLSGHMSKLQTRPDTWPNAFSKHCFRGRCWVDTLAGLLLIRTAMPPAISCTGPTTAGAVARPRSPCGTEARRRHAVPQHARHARHATPRTHAQARGGIQPQAGFTSACWHCKAVPTWRRRYHPPGPPSVSLSGGGRGRGPRRVNLEQKVLSESAAHQTFSPLSYAECPPDSPAGGVPHSPFFDCSGALRGYCMLAGDLARYLEW